MPEGLDPHRISFRELAEGDMGVMHHWFHVPHVQEWWDDWGAAGPTIEEVRKKYLPGAEDRKDTRSYLILYDEKPIGYIQEYLIADHPEYADAVQVDGGAAGLDLFIGEPAYVHRGLGAPLITRFLDELVFPRPGVTSCVIGPSVSNVSAIRSYEKAGFSYLKTVAIPGEKEPEYLMRLAPT